MTSCDFCDKDFIKTRRWQRYCSDICQRKASYKQNKEYRKQYLKDYREKLPVEKKKQYAHSAWIKVKTNPVKYQERLSTSKKFCQEYMARNRNKIFKIYRYKCAICEFSSVLDIHHINDDGKGDTNFNRTLSEYIVLCPNHHTMYHRGLIDKEYLLKFQKEVTELKWHPLLSEERATT